MSLEALLEINDPKDTRRAFNDRAHDLIDAIRAGNGTQNGAEADLMILVSTAGQQLIRYLHVPPQITPEDVVQDAAITMLIVARNPQKYGEIGTPYDYLLNTMRNHVIHLKTRKRLLTTTDIEALNGESGESTRDVGEDWQVNASLRHLRSTYEQELQEELGELFTELRENNGLTRAERKVIEKAAQQLEDNHEQMHLGEIAWEYYMGDLMKPNIITSLATHYNRPEGTIKRQLSTAREELHTYLEIHEHALYDPPRARAQEEDDSTETDPSLKEKLERIERYRTMRRGPQDDVEEVMPRHYISPTAMIRRFHKTPGPDLEARLHTLLETMLTTRRDEEILLDDRYELPAHEVFHRSYPLHQDGTQHHGGRMTIYIDEQAQGFIGRELGIDYKPAKPGWESVTEFNGRLGRHTGHARAVDYDKETFEWLYDLWLHNKDVEIGGVAAKARDHIEFCTSSSHPKAPKYAEGVTLAPEAVGHIMYIDPALEPFAREHLVCAPRNGEKEWLRIHGNNHHSALARLHITRPNNHLADLATHLAAISILEELATQPTIETANEPKKPRQLLGRFLVDGEHGPLEKHSVWLVDEQLVGEGKPLNKEAVEKRRDAILAHPGDYPELLLAQAETDKKHHAKGFLMLRPFNERIGRPGDDHSTRETFDLLYPLWLADSTIEVSKGNHVRARELIEFLQPEDHKQVRIYSQGEAFPDEARDKVMFVSPDLQAFAKEHLLSRPKGTQKELAAGTWAV